MILGLNTLDRTVILSIPHVSVWGLCHMILINLETEFNHININE